MGEQDACACIVRVRVVMRGVPLGRVPPSHAAPSRCHPKHARPRRLHGVHDDAKDKPFELELSWLSEATGWRHVPVPPARVAAAEEWAKAQIDAEDMGED